VGWQACFTSAIVFIGAAAEWMVQMIRTAGC
jgi:hypothetical protein